MALALNDIVQIKASGSYLGTTALNVFFYQVIELGIGTDLTDVLEVFGGDVISTVQEIQHNAFVWNEYSAANLTNELDIASITVSDAGAIGGEAMPPFVAINFRLTRETRLTRNGSKRFGGMAEAFVNYNTWATGYDAAVAAVGVALESNLDVEGESSITRLKPVIVGRNPDGSLNLSAVNNIIEGIATKITSQVSRKTDFIG